MKRVVRILFPIAVAVLATSPQRSIVAQATQSVAQATQSISGKWTLSLGKHTLFVLLLQPSSGPAGPLVGSMSRPTHFATADAVSFSNVTGPTEVDRIVTSQWVGNALSFTTQNPNDSGDKTVYTLTLVDKDDVQLKIKDVPLPPLTLVRSQGSASVADDWHTGQRYFPDDDAPSNPEMKKVFEEDQRVRQTYPKIDWPSVNKSDAIRRTETMKLLTEGALHSGEDFTWAAFVFQHGPRPEDYLMAHTLAVIAIRKGYSDATWIASATLDRYLQSIQQPQIYGTQFLTPPGKAATQEPYNRTLIIDALRHQLGVPDLAAQQVQRQQYDSKRPLDANGK